jgi:hypothetical protein
VDCKKQWVWCQLAFDHLDPDDKGFEIASMSDYKATEENMLKILKETEKCELRCHNCHALRTKAQHEETTAKLDRLAESYMIMIEGRE